MGQFIVENVLLTLVGGLAGFVLSVFVLRAFNQSGRIPYAQLGHGFEYALDRADRLTRFTILM